MAIPATQLRPGMVIKHNNDLHSVFSVEHRTPGNLRAFIQAKLRNLRTGAMFEHRFRSADAIDKITVDEVQMEYLYNDGDDYYFMNTENYEQTHLTRDTLGDSVDYLIANLQIKVEFFDGKAVGMVHFIYHRSNWSIENSCYLQDLLVAPETRGTGVGRLLIEHVYATAKADGCCKVHWLTHETNATAIQLYKRIAERPSALAVA